MRAVLRSGLIMATMVFCAFVVGCGGSSTDGTSASNVIELIVAPDSLNLADIGVTASFTATALSRLGPVSGASATWTSSNLTVADVQGTGLTARVTARGPGVATITATSGGVSGRGLVVVQAPIVTAVTVSPSSVPMTGIGATANVTAVATGPNGIVNNPTITWSSANPNVATVSGSGISATITTRGYGSTTISAMVGQVAGTAAITVNPPPPLVVSLVATPSTVIGTRTVDQGYGVLTCTLGWTATASGGQGGRWGLTRWRMTFSTGEFVGADSGSTNPANPTGDTIQTGRSYTFNGVWVATWADNTGPVYRPFIVLLSISYIDQAAQVTRTTDPVQMSCG